MVCYRTAYLSPTWSIYAIMQPVSLLLRDAIPPDDVLRDQVVFDQGEQCGLLGVVVDVRVGGMCDVLLFVRQRNAQEDHWNVAQGLPCAERAHEGQGTSVVEGDVREHHGGARLVGQDQGMAHATGRQGVIARLSDESVARGEAVWL